MDLLGGDSESETDLKVNKDYAQRYNKWRRGEELQKLKDKYGEENVDVSSSSSSEDEYAEELTEDVEKQFFKTLSYLKRKDNKIYDESVRFFDPRPAEPAVKQKKNKPNKEKPLSVAEYQRNLIIEKGGQISDDDEADLEKMTNVEQEKAIKDSFKKALRDTDDSEEGEDWGGLLKKKDKTKEEEKKEEDDYREWLAGQKEELKNKEEKEELKGLRDFWTDPNLDEGEKFLRDYILNKRFLEKDEKTSTDVFHDLSADEETIDQQEDFERKYNFRFEEPDQEFIKRYPRTMQSSMRKKDDRRKRHREEVKARKEAERAKKDEELKRLKALKRSEIMEKIKKLQDITGNSDIGFENNDIDGDFDPAEHDKRMSELFSEDYYGAGAEEEKPEFPDLDQELELENWDEWEGDEGHIEDASATEPHCEDPDFIMDCDYDPEAEKELQKDLVEQSKGRRKRRRQSKFAAAVSRKKPLFDPTDKSFEKYVDEYYSLDYEDLIGDLPCRFKYRKVVPNDYGLSIEEILSAPDKELNRWVSIKKIMQRRPDNVEHYDVKAYKRKAANLEKKKKILPSLFLPPEEENSSSVDKANKKKKKRSHSESEGPPTITELNVTKKKKSKLWNGCIEENEPSSAQIPEQASKKEKKKHLHNIDDEKNKLTEPTTVEQPTKKEKKKQHVHNTENDFEFSSTQNLGDTAKKKTDNEANEVEKVVKKKKKQKDLENGANNNASNIKTKEISKELRKKKRKKKKKHLPTEDNVQKVQKHKNKNKVKKKLNVKNDRSQESSLKLSDARLKAYGLNPKKFRNKLKYGKKTS